MHDYFQSRELKELSLLDVKIRTNADLGNFYSFKKKYFKEVCIVTKSRSESVKCIWFEIKTCRVQSVFATPVCAAFYFLRMSFEVVNLTWQQDLNDTNSTLFKKYSQEFCAEVSNMCTPVCIRICMYMCVCVSECGVCVFLRVYVYLCVSVRECVCL